MYQSVTFSDFHDAFRAHDRPDNFSYEGLRLLFDWIEEYEGDTGESVELDVVALCCDYEESDWETVALDYDIDLSSVQDDDDRIELVREYLADHTNLVGEPLPGVFLFASF